MCYLPDVLSFQSSKLNNFSRRSRIFYFWFFETEKPTRDCICSRNKIHLKSDLSDKQMQKQTAAVSGVEIRRREKQSI